MPLRQFNDEGVLDQVALHLLLLLNGGRWGWGRGLLEEQLRRQRRHGSRRRGRRWETAVVVVDKGLHRLQGLVEGLVVRMCGKGVLDQVLKAEAVLLYTSHRLVKEVLQAEGLASPAPTGTPHRPQLD